MKAMARRPREDYQLYAWRQHPERPTKRQTLRAAMDWSYEVLPETEQLVLRRLAVFQGDFTINAAAAVATDERIGTADVFETIANLAAKSLIATDISSDVTYHRLPPP
jgi:predicted ATPase